MNLILSYAFRPLFFLAILYGLIAVGWWGVAWSGHVPMPGAEPNPVFWHAHEMIFGFCAAAIAGFALTAVANWTKRPPVSGMPLLALCSLWLSARVLGLSSNPAAMLPMASADLAFNVLLLALMGREVIAGNSRRNYKLLALLGLLGLSNAAFYATHWLDTDWSQTALWAGLWVVVLIVNLIAGRIIPAFTGNWLVQQGKLPKGASRPPPFGPIDLFATVATGLFAAMFLWQQQSMFTATVGVVAAGLQLLRWSRWQFFRTLGSPIVWVLQLAFVWLPVGLALLACAAAGLLPVSTGMHALLIGAVTTMILAVASRAALGHTNRPLLDHPVTTASYVGISVTALLRIVASVSDQPEAWLLLSTVAWLIALGLFAWRYTSILLGPPAP